MKKFFKLLLAVILLTGIFHNPLVGQTSPNETTTSTDVDRDREDNSGKWGLLGLLGLLGFIGIKKNEKTGNYSNTNTPYNR